MFHRRLTKKSAGCRALLWLAISLMAIGCKTAVKTVATTGKLVGGTAGTAGKVAGKAAQATATTTYAATKTTVGAGGKATVTALKTTGTVAKTGVETTASLAKIPLVTFKDASTQTIRQIPWTEGLKLYTASKTAEMDLYCKGFTIFRDGGAKVLRGDWSQVKAGKPEPELQPGDFVEIRPLAAGK